MVDRGFITGVMGACYPVLDRGFIGGVKHACLECGRSWVHGGVMGSMLTSWYIHGGVMDEWVACSPHVGSSR